MADASNNLEQQVEQIIRASFAQQQADEQETQCQDNAEEKRVIDVDLYRFEGGAVLFVPNTGQSPLERDAVESQPPTPATETPSVPLTFDEQQEAETSQHIEPIAPANTKRRVKPCFVLVPLVLLCLLAVGAASYWFLLPLTASATITIIPKARSLHTDTMFPIAAHPKAGEVQGRPLERISFTKSTTVPATGRGHNDAMAAKGVITFYNADTQAYTIPAGTSFAVGSVTVVTDMTVTIQAALPPAFGVGITTAHVVQVGSAGNIAVHALYIHCCGSQFLTATNSSAFTGGQDARDYSFVQTSDIQNAASDLLARLTPQATAALQQQARAREQLVTPLCTPRTISSLDAGTEGASVTVSVTQTCTSVAYLTDSLNQVATSVLTHAAHLANYQEVGTIQVAVNGSVYQQQTAHLNVSLAGVWVYHFSTAQLTRFKAELAGKSQQEAQRILNRQEGIRSVSIHLQRFDFQDTLPTSPQRISLQFFYIVS